MMAADRRTQQVTLSDPTAQSPTFVAPDDPDVLVFSLPSSMTTAAQHNTGHRPGSQSPTKPRSPTRALTNRAPTESLVTLDGSGSYDPDHDGLTFEWIQTGGPAVSLSSTTAESPTFTAPATASRLTFSLRVRDAYGARSAPDQTTSTSMNRRSLTCTCPLWSPTTPSCPTWSSKASPRQETTSRSCSRTRAMPPSPTAFTSTPISIPCGPCQRQRRLGHARRQQRIWPGVGDRDRADGQSRPRHHCPAYARRFADLERQRRLLSAGLQQYDLAAGRGHTASMPR